MNHIYVVLWYLKQEVFDKVKKHNQSFACSTVLVDIITFIQILKTIFREKLRFSAENIGNTSFLSVYLSLTITRIVTVTLLTVIKKSRKNWRKEIIQMKKIVRPAVEKSNFQPLWNPFSWRVTFLIWRY